MSETSAWLDGLDGLDWRLRFCQRLINAGGCIQLSHSPISHKSTCRNLAYVQRNVDHSLLMIGQTVSADAHLPQDCPRGFGFGFDKQGKNG
jgi:hypothetical protein